MNQLIGERLSIITSKAQTTRHRIMGIVNGELEGTEFQLVYSDTPGIIKPQYELHESMMEFVHGSLEDADVVLFVTDIFEKYDEEDVIAKLGKSQAPVLLIINKMDLATAEHIAEKEEHWKNILNPREIMTISALNGDGLEQLFGKIIELLPTHPPYFPKDALTDKPERFFVSEIVREKIFLNYRKEVPYSCEVVVSGFQEEESIIRADFFQRLRNIKQLGFSEYVFPGATNTRFIHSIGVMHIGNMAFDKLFAKKKQTADLLRIKETFKLGCLLHDIGHAPLSHSTESVMPMLSELKIPEMFVSKKDLHKDRQASHEDYTIKALADSLFAEGFQDVESKFGVERRYIADLITGHTTNHDILQLIMLITSLFCIN